MKKILFLVSAISMVAFADEISCDDMLRNADSAGVSIMPSTFNSIQRGSWVCHEENGSYVAVSLTEHHILRIDGTSSVDSYVERLADGEREVSVRIENNRRHVAFLPFGRIDELQSPYL